MGNSNVQEGGQGALEVYKHSSFYGRHELRNGKVVKKYELPSSQATAFLGLINSYQKVDHPSLLPIEQVQRTPSSINKEHFQLVFPYISLTLDGEMRTRKRTYNEREMLRIIIDVGEAISIFHSKQFPYEQLSPQKIAVRQHHQGYCIGVDILMNPHNCVTQSQEFKSPEALDSALSHHGFDRSKSALYSLGLIALRCGGVDGRIEENVFELRKHFSYDFCNLMEAIMRPENHLRISLEECLDICNELIEKEENQMIERVFIRGYNCVESLWFFENLNQEGLQPKINQ